MDQFSLNQLAKNGQTSAQMSNESGENYYITITNTNPMLDGPIQFNNLYENQATETDRKKKDEEAQPFNITMSSLPNVTKQQNQSSRRGNQYLTANAAVTNPAMGVKILRRTVENNNVMRTHLDYLKEEKKKQFQLSDL